MKESSRGVLKHGVSGLTLVYVATMLVLGGALLVSRVLGLSVGDLTRDPTVTLGGNPLTGAQSNLGVLIWFAASAICLFCWWVLREREDQEAFSSFALWSGVLSLVWALDDLFQIHEALAVRLFGISERVTMAAYAALVILYLVRFRRLILASSPLLLGIAFLFLGSSVLVDLFQDYWASPWRIFFEDGFKLLGIVSWSSCLIRLCVRHLVATLNDAASSSPKTN